jgi:hypothetical protein
MPGCCRGRKLQFEGLLNKPGRIKYRQCRLAWPGRPQKIMDWSEPWFRLQGVLVS